MPKLHGVTWLMIWCGLAAFLVHVATFVAAVGANYWQGRDENVFVEALQKFLIDGGYALAFLGTAATVELLYRIWRVLDETAAKDEGRSR